MPGDPGWRASASRRAQASAIPVIVTPLVSAFAATWSWRIDGQHHLDALHAARQPYVLAVWHGRILPGIGWLRHRGMVALASENFDGEWIARIIQRFGFGAARGSSSRGGARALRVLMRSIAAAPAAFTVDGPRGPRGVAHPGIVWLARATGHPILPIHAAADRAWTLGSWDRTHIPKPWSRVVLTIGAPMRVAREAGEAALDDARLDVEARLRACEAATAARLAAAPQGR